MKQFVWNPGQGVDATALARMRAHFKCPDEPMGEAWFMSAERRLFHELEGDLATLSAGQLKKPLEEIASGTSSFGPRAEWNSWYHYLLGQLSPRSHEHFVSSLLEPLITGFMALYPNGIHSSPYPQFHDDALATLGRCMMDPDCWTGSEIAVGRILHRSNNNPRQVWCWWDASGDFSASLFFCMKYLPEPLIRGWLKSVLDITSPHWRAQMMVWLIGAHEILSGRVNWPSEFLVEARPSICWDGSHCLKPVAPALIRESVRAQVLERVRSYFTEDVFLEWLTSIARIPYLEAELAELPSTFEQLYVTGRGF